MTPNEKRRKWNLEHNWKPPYPGKREKCRLWKGGIKISKDGYRLIYKPEHPMARKDGYILEHRFNLSKKIDRLLLPTEIVHHINHNKLDNRSENLELHISLGSHKKIHSTLKDSTNGRFIHNRNSL